MAFLLALAVGRGVAVAANCYWKAAGTANFDAATTNWSCGHIPMSTDTVLFDGAGTSGATNQGCTFDVAVSVAAITFQNAYSKTVTGGASAITTTGNWTMSTGTFTAGSGTIQIGGNLALSGGTFTASTGSTQITGIFNKTGGTFGANGGTVFLASASTVSHTFGGAMLANILLGQSGTTGLVGYWKLDEASGTTTADSSGTGNTGTLSAGGVTRMSASLPSVTGDVRAMTFDGSSGYVSLGVTSLPNNAAAQSISLWFKSTPDGNNHNMLAMGALGSGSAVQLGFRGSSLVAWTYGGAALVSTTAPVDGAWHHVAYTYDGTTDSIYLDGVLQATSTTSTHQTATPTSAYLGTYDGASELFAGSLDDVRVFTRALASAEVATLAAGSSFSTIAGTHTFSDAFVCSGNLSVLAGTLKGTHTLSVGGNWLNSGTYSNTGAVTLTGTSASGTITSGGGSFGSLTVNGSGGTYTLQDALSVTGDFTITAGTLTGTKTISVGGSWSNSGIFSDTGTVTLTGTTAGKTILSGGSHFSALTLNGVGGTYTISDRLWVPGGTITLTNGTLNGGSSIIHAGSFSVGSGTFAAGTGTLILDGTSNQSLPFSTLSGLRLEDPSESNLVGYWKLDEDQGTAIADLSGNGNGGTVSGTSWQTSVPATVTFDDYASLVLNGSSAYATLGTNNLPATNAAITISAWVNLTSTAGNQNMVALTGASGNFLQLGLRNGYYTAWPSGAGTTVTGPAATTGAWHHVAYTYDGSSVDTIYVDGVAYVGTFTHQSGATTAAYLGTYSPPSSELLAGALDDVRIYNVALTASQITQLAAGRYPGLGGYATTTLSANTTVSGQLALDAAVLNANGKTMGAGSAAAALASVNAGTYTVGGAAQTFSGGLTVQPGGTLTLATSGGSVQIASGKTLTIDGTLNASSTSATIQGVAGAAYTFKVGSSASVTPTLNVSGLAVKNTSGGMQIGATTGSTTTFTQFDNLLFSGGTGSQYLLINATSLFLSSSGCTFDSGLVTGGPTKAVTAAGDGTANGETRAVFGGTKCAQNWALSASDTVCTTTAKSDDDSDNNGVADSATSGTNGAVVEFVRSASDDTAGSIVGFPTAAFNWNTFAYYSTYAAFHNAASGTSDVVYVRDESGNALYSWTVPTAGETITGTPQWNSVTVSGTTTHYVYVATSAGHVYRLIDTATGTTSGTLSLDASGAWATNPYNCSCTIVTPLAQDSTNLYWGGTPNAGGQGLWTLGQASESVPTGGAPFTVTPTITSAAPSRLTLSGTSYLYLGLTGHVLKINVSNQTLSADNTSPGTNSVWGRIAVGQHSSTVNRIYAGDDGGTMWAIDATNFAGTNKLWSYNTANAIKSAPYYDYLTDTIQYGTQGGTIIALTGSGAVVNSGYPYTPTGGAGDPIQAAPLFNSGVLVVGSTGGKLYFLDRNTGTTVSIIKEYAFGSGESVSGVAFDPSVSRYMVTTSNPSTKDGRLYFFDAVTDPTPGSS